MYLTRIELNQWRCFEKAEVDLDRPFTLVAGVNGSGKTSLLKAIELGMSHFPGAPRRRAPEVEQQLSASGDRLVSRARACSLGFHLKSGASETIRPGRESLQLIHAWSNLRQATDLLGFLLLSLDDGRSEGPDELSYDEPRVAQDVAYEDWDRPGVPWWAVERWLGQQTQVGYERFYKAVSENRGTPRLEDLVPELTAASTAIADVIDEAVRVEYNVQFKKLLIHLSGGRILEPSQLSAGYRTLLALISDLARRCVLLNPAAGARAPYETPGLVLIDELELHLHPKWQRQVVKGLQRAFPKIQFVCTTHSPQILSEAPADSVVLLGPNDTVLYPKYTHGRDANAILEEILGTPARPVEIDALFGAFRGAIDERRWAEADQLLGRLESALGSDTAEVISAHWSLEVQRSPESEASAEDAQPARSES